MLLGDVLNSGECSLLFSHVTNFVNDSMREYVDKVTAAYDVNGFPSSGKDIFDYVWGSVKFSPEELCVLDSPLLQRLRMVKQLGCASTVYCNADHSRFSHTIGAFEVSKRMANAIQKDKRLEKSDKYNATNIVKMAAIFHDVGHSFYSHVSEVYFSKNTSGLHYSKIEQALNYFRRHIGSEKVKLHELIGVMIVNTDIVCKLLLLVGQPFFKDNVTKNMKDIRTVVDYISCLIIGQSSDYFLLPFSKIINGAIDADKIDYLSRDSACTKVPVGIDVARLIEKLTVVNLKESDFKRPIIWNEPDDNTAKAQVMAFNYSARKACWQLYMARSIMFESVYYHQKKLSAEAMFRCGYEYFEKCVEDSSFGSLETALSLCDDFFNNKTINLILDNVKTDSVFKETTKSIFTSMEDRNLWKRVASISSVAISHRNEGMASQVAFSNLTDEVISFYHSPEQITFFDSLAQELKIIADLLNIKIESEYCLFAFIESYPSAEENSELGDTYIEQGDGQYKKASEVFKGEPWMQGKDNKQQEYFLITNVPNRDLVYLALERVLFKREEKFILGVESLYCSKISKTDILKLKIWLLYKGYYNDSLELLPDDIIMFLVDKNIFKNVIDKYRSFQGTDRSIVSEDELRHFLRQFLLFSVEEDNIKVIIDGVLRVLFAADFVDRSVFVEATIGLFEKIKHSFSVSEEQMTRIRVGNSGDSETSWSYYFNDVPKHPNDAYLEMALESENQQYPLVFFDDGAYSGSQIISIFQEYMGVPKEDRTTTEFHVNALSCDKISRLKTAKIILAYLFFNEDSEEYIKGELRKLGVENITIIYQNSLCRKVFSRDDVFVNEEQKKLTEKAFKEIGYEIMKSIKSENGTYKDRWSEQRVSSSALGYNDAQQIIVFERNIPTYTLTALWQNGEYKNSKWRGLFQRTEK